MSSRMLPRSLALGVAALVSLAARGQPPKVVVAPFAQGEGAPDKAAARFTQLVTDEIKTRDALELVAPFAAKASPEKSGKAAEAAAHFQAGGKASTDLRFDEAAAAYRKGLEAALSDPGSTDYPAVYDALINLAVAYFRMGEEKKAQGALYDIARLDPTFKLPTGYPPVFIREFEKAKKKVEKAAKGNLEVDGPPGSTAFINGRDLGMVPVLEENLAVGVHYVKVEGPRGERFGAAVELKGGTAKVKGTFDKAPSSQAAPAVAEVRIGAALDEKTATRASAFGQAAGADYVLLGIVYRTGSSQLVASSALYSVGKNAFTALPSHAFDHDMGSANAEAFRLADEVVARTKSFGPVASLPLQLVTKQPERVAVADATPELEIVAPRRAVARPEEKRTDPAAATVRAFEPKSVMVGVDGTVGEDVPPPPKRGVSPAVWVLVGVGVLAGAGGAYYGITQASRPVTGTVTARWP